MEWLARSKKWLAGLAAAAAAAAGYFLWPHEEVPQAALFADDPALEAAEEQVPAETEPSVSVMKVDVKGAVKHPGVFTAQQGDRVIDIIDAAGGFAKDADADQVNLAQLAADQMVIYVPVLGEAPPASVPAASGAPSAGSPSDSGAVNINTAGEDELMTLTGIGPSKAAAILEYRTKNGPFETAEDLKKVSGIGDKTFEKLKEAVTVQ